MYDYMRQHYDDLAVEFGAGRILWRTPLKVFASLKLVDENGNTPTRDTAIRTWQRARADVAAARVRQQAAKAGQPLGPGEVAPGVRIMPSPGATGWDNARLSQMPGGLLSQGDAVVPAVQPGPVPGTLPDGSGDASSSHLDRLRASMEAGKVPTPKVV